MLSPFIGFNERDLTGIYSIAVPMNSGLAVIQDSTDATPLTPSPYGNFFGRAVAASCLAANNLTETGWVMQPVTATGPSVFSLLSSIYDESIAAGAVASVLLSKKKAQIATDQYVTGAGAGAIKFDGTVPRLSLCGIANGQPRVAQAGDSNRLVFLGQVTQRNTPCAIFEIQ